MRLAGYSDMKHPLRSREHRAGNDLDRLLALHTDSCIKLDVRFALRTTDGALIVMTDECLRAGPPAVIEKLVKVEAVNPGSYYFRTNPMFESSTPKYD
jgi:hypothetical protein